MARKSIFDLVEDLNISINNTFENKYYCNCGAVLNKEKLKNKTCSKCNKSLSDFVDIKKLDKYFTHKIEGDSFKCFLYTFIKESDTEGVFDYAVDLKALINKEELYINNDILYDDVKDVLFIYDGEILNDKTKTHLLHFLDFITFNNEDEVIHEFGVEMLRELYSTIYQSYAVGHRGKILKSVPATVKRYNMIYSAKSIDIVRDRWQKYEELFNLEYIRTDIKFKHYEDPFKTIMDAFELENFDTLLELFELASVDKSMETFGNLYNMYDEEYLTLILSIYKAIQVRDELSILIFSYIIVHIERALDINLRKFESNEVDDERIRALEKFVQHFNPSLIRINKFDKNDAHGRLFKDLARDIKIQGEESIIDYIHGGLYNYNINPNTFYFKGNYYEVNHIIYTGILDALMLRKNYPYKKQQIPKIVDLLIQSIDKDIERELVNKILR